MKGYFDTGLLVKLYILEANSHTAVKLVHDHQTPIIFTHLHETELQNAIRLKCFRGEITRREAQTAINTIRTDFSAGKLFRPSLDWPEIWHQANQLSARFAVQIGARTLDTLHVATATLLKTSKFISFDVRQRTLAKKTGLTVIPQVLI